jgi:hypothetical protein
MRGPNNSVNTGIKMTIIGYLGTMFTIVRYQHYFQRKSRYRG